MSTPGRAENAGGGFFPESLLFVHQAFLGNGDSRTEGEDAGFHHRDYDLDERG